METRLCKKCKVVKPIDEFYKHYHKQRKYLYISTDCKNCRGLYFKELHAKRVQDPLFKEKRRIRSLNYSYVVKYGLSAKEKEEKILQQNNKCEICQETLKSFSKSCVDHNHRTGQVRGILCNKCNFSLASIEDITFLEKALTYLAKYNKSN